MASGVAINHSPFLWEGTDTRGKKVHGKTVAANEAAVRAQLRKQGVVPVRIRKESSLFKRGGKVTPYDIAIFSRQLSTMLTAGIPLVQAFEIVGNGHDNPAMQKLILGIKVDLESGTALAEALGRHPLYFDDLYVNLVTAGEQAGALDTLLDKVATYKEKTEAIKKKIKKALFYPAAVLIVAVIVTMILLIFVIPQFESLFKGFGADLPAFTRMVIDLSKFVQSLGWLVALVIGGGVYFYMYTRKRSHKVREFEDRLMLKMPIVGNILEKAAVARFAASDRRSCLETSASPWSADRFEQDRAQTATDSVRRGGDLARHAAARERGARR